MHPVLHTLKSSDVGQKEGGRHVSIENATCNGEGGGESRLSGARGDENERKYEDRIRQRM